MRETVLLLSGQELPWVAKCGVHRAQWHITRRDLLLLLLHLLAMSVVHGLLLIMWVVAKVALYLTEIMLRATRASSTLLFA
jgi:hypothetical protein